MTFEDFKQYVKTRKALDAEEIHCFMDEMSNEAPVASEHFRKYKLGTLHVVKSLVLSDQMPLDPANKINNFIQ